jgi:uncharacterized protein (TIGR02687 family)
MDLSKATSALEKIFFEEDERVVFWNDPDGEFLKLIPELTLPDVSLINLDESSALETKISLEIKGRSKKYLLYSAKEEPEFNKDWLLDIRLYSRSFRADRASIILNELGLARMHLRDHISKRRKFFDSKERSQRLKESIKPSDTEFDIDRKMLGVITKANTDDLSNILRTVFHQYTEEEDFDLNQPPKVWAEIEKFDLDTSFWELINSQYGYSEKSPSLRNLLFKMLATDFAFHFQGDLPESLDNLLLDKSGHRNTVVCLGHWRDSSKKANSYNRLSDIVSKTLNIDAALGTIHISEVVGIDTFSDIEKLIVQRLLATVPKVGSEVNADSITNVVKRRQTSHWCSSSSIPRNLKDARNAVYEAISLASEFLHLRALEEDGFSCDSPEKHFNKYSKIWFKFDQIYRQFCEHTDTAKKAGLDWLKPLKESIEAHYNNWYLPKLSLSWNEHLRAGLLNQWRISGSTNQYLFFENYVRPNMRGNKLKRTFVIISDAFRFEVAEELTQALNGYDRIEASLENMLGVLPSYTKLGMASLLPHHNKLKYAANGAVLANGKPTASFENRCNILESESGFAFKSPHDLMKLKKDAGRDAISDKKVVYIYHNVIDATGDTAATESHTFEACRKTINEIQDLVRFLLNHLNANNILITADHGFLFSETTPVEADRSRLTERPTGTITAKKRYLIGENLPDNEDVWLGDTSATARTINSMNFWIPKGVSRFHFVGGARFIHGGAMPQEVVVPLIKVRHRKDKESREQAKTGTVTVQVIGSRPKITTQKHKFNLIQMEPVTDKIRPITVKIAIYDGNEPVSAIETVTFDSDSSNLEDLKKSVFVTLQDCEFDRSKPYRLVLKDMDNIEIQSIDVTIDRMIADDF